jgi:hypothetical protein
MAVIAPGPLRGIGQQDRVCVMARLSAWDKRQMPRAGSEAERRARAAKGGRVAEGPGRYDADANGER